MKQNGFQIINEVADHNKIKEVVALFLKDSKEGPNKPLITKIEGSIMLTKSIFYMFGYAYLLGKLIKLYSKLNKEYTKKIQHITGKNYKVYSIPDTLPNAMKTFGSKDIFITTYCLRYFTEREIIAILLHEIAHGESHDIIRTSLASILSTTSLKVFLLLTKAGSKFIYASGAPVALGFHLLPFFIVPFISRLRETAADKYVIRYGYKDDMISALIKIDKYVKRYEAKLKKKSKFQYYSNRFNQLIKLIFGGGSHPSIKKRISSLEKNANKIVSSKSLSDLYQNIK